MLRVHATTMVYSALGGDAACVTGGPTWHTRRRTTSLYHGNAIRIIIHRVYRVPCKNTPRLPSAIKAPIHHHQSRANQIPSSPPRLDDIHHLNDRRKALLHILIDPSVRLPTQYSLDKSGDDLCDCAHERRHVVDQPHSLLDKVLRQQ